ncbi:Receptor-type tyrosine-protein phosphatase S [Lamellibrachia satsuma]|nr:Receptor-type tyrosine-protein phosphatase S [Lamellibrachia satsuma]
MSVVAERARPYLVTHDSSDSTDYINAVYVDGYRQTNAYIVTQWPLKSTINDIWRLVYDYKIPTIVLLDNVSFSRQYPRFWPTCVGESVHYGPLSVRLTQEEETSMMAIKVFQICKVEEYYEDDEGSKPEILARIAQTTAALTRLKPLWNDRNITVSSKIRLMRSLVMSIFLYACETWTLSADLQKRIQAMEMRCFRKILHISYKDHVTNDAVRNKIKQAIGPYDDLLTTVKKRKLKWYGHVSRSCGLAKIILQGTVRGGDEERKKYEGLMEEIVECLQERSSPVSTQMLVALQVSSNGSAQPVIRTVKMFVLRCWPSHQKVPSAAAGIIELLSQVEDWQMKNCHGRIPTCVISRNGVSRGGCYCVISIAWDKLREEGVVDIFRAVNMVKMNRPQLVDNLAEYIYCYTFMMILLDYVHAQGQQQVTQSMQAQGQQQVTQSMQAQGQQQVTQSMHAQGQLQVMQSMQAQGLKQVTRSMQAQGQQQVTQSMQAHSQQQVTQSMQAKGLKQVNKSVQAQGQQQVTQRLHAQSQQLITQSMQAQGQQQVTQCMQAHSQQQVTQSMQAHGLKQVTQSMQAQVLKQVTRSVQAQGHQQVAQSMQAQGQQQVTQGVQAQDQQQVTPNVQAQGQWQVIQNVQTLGQQQVTRSKCVTRNDCRVPSSFDKRNMLMDTDQQMADQQGFSSEKLPQCVVEPYCFLNLLLLHVGDNELLSSVFSC